MPDLRITTVDEQRWVRGVSGLLVRYPQDLVRVLTPDIHRQAFHLELVDRLSSVDGSRIVDIGGGLSMFTPACSVFGAHCLLVDDFADSANQKFGNVPDEVHRALGVEVISRDVVAEGLGLEPETVDLVASFDSMEHWHNSPKALFAEVMKVLRPGGWFLLGVPNALNLRKRVMVPLGRAKWSHMTDWYEQPIFRGHVREPDVDDLQYIARDMGLQEVSIIGRNWQGYKNPRSWVRQVTPYLDRSLRRRPSLCSDLYLVGRK